MKCVCGYEENIEDESTDFIASSLYVAYEEKVRFTMEVMLERVYICPEYGTLKIEV